MKLGRLSLHTLLFCWCLGIVCSSPACAQEGTAPLRFNPFVAAAPVKHLASRKVTATLSLPFFEDFTTYSVFPDSTRWTDREVYVNNTMAARTISRGVATFDDLDWRGLPYDSFSNTNFRYADSLTSQPIDLSGHVPGDSIYLSFFYQPQGNSYYPLVSDSLILYMKTSFGGFSKVWAMPGTTLRAFRQVMIPIYDSLYFHNAFQFRFVNKAAHYWSGAVWNVDYIRMDASRNMYDTAVNDLAFTTDPTFLLNDYTSMPYRQFLYNPASERTSNLYDSIRNNYNSDRTVTYGFTASAVSPSTVLQAPLSATTTVNAGSAKQVSFPSYAAIVPGSSVGYYDRVVFENKFFLQSPSTADPSANDTIVKSQVFDNYLAYDDGSAEKSYYLNLYPTLPGEISIEYYLNQPDTMRGLAIYFGRQVPFATYKTFSIRIYSSLAGVSGGVVTALIDSQDFCQPGYADTINHFWIYRLDRPVALPSGTFYAGIRQPAESGSDSLYIGLDVNRVGGNHVYYNVIGSWVPSLITGAVMMRPLLGQAVTGSSVDAVATGSSWSVSPNPAGGVIKISFQGDRSVAYRIADMNGREVLSGNTTGNAPVDVSALAPGMYLVYLRGTNRVYAPSRFVKM